MGIGRPQSGAGRPTMRSMVLAALLLGLRVSGEHRDLLLQAMCTDKCNKAGSGGRDCREKCYREPLEKAGFCGNSSDPFLNSCLDECHSDKDCSWLDKCCTHKCGRTCQPPEGLKSTSDLPPIPENVTLLQLADMKNVLVDWKHEGGCQYVIELQEESGPWMPAHKVPRVIHPLRIPVRPGVEYAARVAAVNLHGSRGFSQPSNTIILHLGAPAGPEGLSFKGSLKNGSVSGLLSWQPPNTDQYIIKYTVEWRHQFVVEEAPDKKGLLEVHKKSVPHGKHCLRIRKLYPNSSYTFYVQALVLYRQEMISSNKAELIVDTKRFSSISKRGVKQRPKHFHVFHKVIQTKEGQNMKISWTARGNMKYAITWEADCDPKSISVVTTGSNYIIPDIKKGCTYQVYIKEKSDCKKRRKLGKLAFKVP